MTTMNAATAKSNLVQGRPTSSAHRAVHSYDNASAGSHVRNCFCSLSIGSCAPRETTKKVTIAIGNGNRQEPVEFTLFIDREIQSAQCKYACRYH